MIVSVASADAIFPRPRRVRHRAGCCPARAARRVDVHRIRKALHQQWYRLEIRNDGVKVISASLSGERYARLTLRQLTESGAAAIRCMDIEDWPDFAARGVTLDISRDKVPTMRTLRRLVDLLAGWKINQLQLYTEHTFAYRGHERVWRGASPMTGGQIETLDRYCRARGVELVPNQNSFGHMERWLRHEPYRALAETTGRWKTPWGTVRDRPTTLNPQDPRSLRLVTSLYDQLLPHFSSRLLNVGCDETFELGQGKSAAACKQRGIGRVYLDYLLKLHRAVRGLGRRMMFWSDIVQEHPEVIRHLPRDLIALVWGYEADHPFGAQCRQLKRAGLEFYVCPGTSSWCSFAGRMSNALTNLRIAAEEGKCCGAAGYLITDWGDYGHRQYLPASYAGLLYGAGVSWCAAANHDLGVAAEVGRRVFGEEPSELARLWCEAGRIHERSGLLLKNKTVLFSIMESPLRDVGQITGLSTRRVERMERQTETLLKQAVSLRPKTAMSEHALARRELIATLYVLRHACLRARFALSWPTGCRQQRAALQRLAADMRDIMARHRELWRARNRPGGLRSSMDFYRRNLHEYDESVRRA